MSSEAAKAAAPASGAQRAGAEGEQQQPAAQGQQQGGHGGAPKTVMLQDIPKDELLTMKQRVLYEQAVRGEQPGLSIMQDRLGPNIEDGWGMTEKNEEPEVQN